MLIFSPGPFFYIDGTKLRYARTRSLDRKKERNMTVLLHSFEPYIQTFEPLHLFNEVMYSFLHCVKIFKTLRHNLYAENTFKHFYFPLIFVLSSSCLSTGFKCVLINIYKTMKQNNEGTDKFCVFSFYLLM